MGRVEAVVSRPDASPNGYLGERIVQPQAGAWTRNMGNKKSLSRGRIASHAAPHDQPARCAARANGFAPLACRFKRPLAGGEPFMDTRLVPDKTSPIPRGGSPDGRFFSFCSLRHTSGHSNTALFSQNSRFWLKNADFRRVGTDIRFPPPRCRRDSERIELPEWVRKWVSRHVALIQLLGPHSPLPTRRSSSSHRNTLPITSGPFFLARLPDHAACRHAMRFSCPAPTLAAVLARASLGGIAYRTSPSQHGPYGSKWRGE